jgi:Fic-DOC domain mobile mystery protein B
VGLTGAHAPGATPIEPDDVEGLIPGHIRTQAELNEWEEANILQARAWLARPRVRRAPFDYLFALRLHKQMFGKTWRWAGQIRQREANIGVDPGRIAQLLPQALANAEVQLSKNPADVDRIAAQLHHRLVVIHSFGNGNGRHARQLVDVLLSEQGHRAFTWGSGNLTPEGDVRARYLTALRAADNGDFAPLYTFVRS